MFKPVVVTKQPTSDIFDQHLQFFSPNVIFLCCIYLCELKQSDQEFYDLIYLVLFLVC